VGRERLGGRLAEAGHGGADEALAVDRPVNRLAEQLVVEGRLLGLEEDVVEEPDRRLEDLEVRVLLEPRRLGGRQPRDHVD
jgi:hypothetical protein